MHLLFDQLTRFTYLDYMLIMNNNMYFHKTQHLTHVFFIDILTQLSIFYLPLTSLLSSDYQDMHSTILLLTPELSEVYMDYVYLYILSPSFSVTPSIVFDSYLSN